MAELPAEISTALVHMDAPLSFIGEPGRLHVEILPSVSLVWAATGTPVVNFEDMMDLADGQSLEIQLPHTDQDGFLDGAGNAITGWYYTVKITYEKDGQLRVFPERDFQVLVGQDSVDLALVPAGEATEPMVAPILTVTSIEGFTGAVTLTQLGLERVDNTNDAEKPISTAAQAALDLKAPKANPTFTGTVTGVTKSMVGLGNVDNTADVDKPISTATQTALDTKAPKDSPTFTGTVSGVSKSMVGLGSVDNTADSAKPVSTAQAAAIALKLDASQKGAASGVAPLGADSRVPDANLPTRLAAAALATAASVADSTAVFAAGSYYTPRGGRGTFATTQDRLTVVPFLVPKDQQFVRIGTEVTTAAAGSTIRLGIYNIGPTGLPTTLVVDAGTIDAATIGAKEVTINQTLPAGLYGLAAVAQGGVPTVRTITGGGTMDVGAGSLASATQGNPNTGYYASSVPGALPANFTLADRSLTPTLVALRTA